jgi:hypothetical protein
MKFQVAGRSHQFMSASARSISFDLGSMGYSGAMLETILVSPTGAVGAEPSEPLQLAPYGIFIGEIRSRKGP